MKNGCAEGKQRGGESCSQRHGKQSLAKEWGGGCDEAKQRHPQLKDSGRRGQNLAA